jgi:hypothetical protein
MGVACRQRSVGQLEKYNLHDAGQLLSHGHLAIPCTFSARFNRPLAGLSVAQSSLGGSPHPMHPMRLGVHATSPALVPWLNSCPYAFLESPGLRPVPVQASSLIRKETSWARMLAEVRRGAVPLLTCARTCSIVMLDLATEDIRACEHRGTAGTLATMKDDTEAPFPGAKLITRRSQVPWAAAWAGESWPRYLDEESRLNVPRFRFHPLARVQPDSLSIAVLRSEIGCWPHIRAIAGSSLVDTSTSDPHPTGFVPVALQPILAPPACVNGVAPTRGNGSLVSPKRIPCR